MKLYIYEDGTLAQARLDASPDDFFGNPPTGSLLGLTFDDDTNQTVIQGINSGWDEHTVIGGVLYRNGIPVTINPPTDEHTAQHDATTGYAVLPDWVKTGTANQAEIKINNDFSLPAVGTLENAKTFVNTNLADIPTTVTNVTQLRTAINTKLATTRAIFNAMIDLFIVVRNYYIIIAKLLIYVRDFMWDKFRRN